MGAKTLKLKEVEGQFFNPPESRKKIKIPKLPKVVVISIGIAFILVVLGAGAYYVLNRMGYIQALKMAVQYQKQIALNKADQQILAQLKKIMLLPDDVTPSMAAVMDAQALKERQPEFFANVKNGDRLIIYPDIAIIFDAKANKIIKVGPVQTANTANANINAK